MFLVPPRFNLFVANGGDSAVEKAAFAMPSYPPEDDSGSDDSDARYRRAEYDDESLFSVHCGCSLFHSAQVICLFRFDPGLQSFALDVFPKIQEAVEIGGPWDITEEVLKTREVKTRLVLERQMCLKRSPGYFNSSRRRTRISNNEKATPPRSEAGRRGLHQLYSGILFYQE